ncbi:MAG: hypothetical protein AAFN00_13990 [Cyanobacteria bacterium J06558_2]
MSAYGDVSLASLNDVLVKNIVSEDGGVALISAVGIVTNDGAISSMEDVIFASASNVTITQKIRTKLGKISLASTEGSVKVNTALSSGFGSQIYAKRNITTLGIRSSGNIALEAELGQVIVNGNVRSGGGDVYISGLSRVNLGNITSQGGNISLISDASSIKTGYIKTDSEDKDGNLL